MSTILRIQGLGSADTFGVDEEPWKDQQGFNWNALVSNLITAGQTVAPSLIQTYRPQIQSLTSQLPPQLQTFVPMFMPGAQPNPTQVLQAAQPQKSFVEKAAPYALGAIVLGVLARVLGR